MKNFVILIPSFNDWDNLNILIPKIHNILKNNDKNFSIIIINDSSTIKNNLSFNKENKEYTNEELLKFIFPNESHKLHNYNIKTKDYNLHVEPYYHRYFWECDIEFI